MFPLTANEPYIKETGERSTLGAELGSGGGGGGSLPIATASTLGGVKIGSGINVTGDGTISTPGYNLPAATSEVLGGVKIGSGINVAEDGTISVPGGGGTATKIYYKDFNSPDATNIPLATFSNNTAGASGFNICDFGNSISVNVSGYTPISAIAIDVYTGYAFNVSIKRMGTNWYLSLGLASRQIDSGSLKVRVLYVEDANYAAIPS